ncbi:hypothetical protein Ancab_013594 [Ancistrocladus abbreviatus]
MGTRAKGTTGIEVGADGVAIITIINPPVNSLSFDGVVTDFVCLGVKYEIQVESNQVMNYGKYSWRIWEFGWDNQFTVQFVAEYYLKVVMFWRVLWMEWWNEEELVRGDTAILFTITSKASLTLSGGNAIVVTGAKEKFSGGFDITAFGAIQEGKVAAPKRGFVAVDILTDTVEAARKPSVAAVDGLALGGGLEVAMGVIPGFGGTQRLPRLVGLPKALEMMLTSKPIKGVEAQSLGLVDRNKLDPLGDAREILNFARAQAQKQAPNLKHPLICIDVVEEGIVAGPRAGLWKEADAFEELLRSDTCKSLVHIFFAQRGTSKVPGVTDQGLMPRNIKKVAVLGGGLMGSGIATALILSNCPVILKEVNEKLLTGGYWESESQFAEPC